MKILILGGGDFADMLRKVLTLGGENEVKVLSKAECDVTNYAVVCYAIKLADPDFVVCTAGLSDKVIGTGTADVLDANLLGPMNVGTAAHAYKVPCLLVASTAGISPGTHVWYGPAKAGVINFVRAMANTGAAIWALSPGRMDTKMRQADFPDEDPRTRLSPLQVAIVARRIIDGDFAPGANVVVRKVGLTRVDTYEEVAPCLPSLL